MLKAEVLLLGRSAAASVFRIGLLVRPATCDLLAVSKLGYIISGIMSNHIQPLKRREFPIEIGCGE